MQIWQKAFIGCLLTTVTAMSYATVDIRVLNPDGTAAANVVVFALSDSVDLPTSQTSSIEIAQQDKLFQPYITVMQRQDKVQFVNRDDFTHHIYSLSEGNRFSFKLRAGQQQGLELQHQDKAIEQVAMGCNIHDWMSGFLLILDTPYFAHTDTTGHVSLPLQDNGEYQLYLWHPMFTSEEHIYSRNLSYPAQMQIEWNLQEQLNASEPQASDDDFEFLDEY